MKVSKTKLKYFCIDCGIEIWYGSIRCNSCSMKDSWKRGVCHSVRLIGKKARNFKHGKCCKDKHYYCADCGTELSNYKAKRCHPCLFIFRKKSGYRPKNYKGGLPKCVDCGKQLSNYNSQRCNSCASKIKAKNNWNNPRYRTLVTKVLLNNQQAIIKILHNSPNLIEQRLIKIIPKNFKFVGNGKIMVDRFNPDFIDKKNKLIVELYGDYWHNREDYKERDKRRLKTYKRLGYKTLIIWEKELKNLDLVKEKIIKFNKHKCL